MYTTSMQKNTVTLVRYSLFMVYFWFGILKVFNLSPAEQLVQDLFNQTLAWLLPFSLFYVGFSLFECVLGILFLVKGQEKLAVSLMLLHIFTTAMPLVLLPDQTWHTFLVPTLVGQYILKNILIIALGFVLLDATKTKLPFFRSKKLFFWV